MALSSLEQRGVHVEADGSIVLVRTGIAPPAASGAAGQQADHVVYSIANPALTATFENPGRIGAYRVIGSGPLLEPGSWQARLLLDDAQLTGYPPMTRARGHLLVETWPVQGCRLTVSSFCDEQRNIIYQAYQLQSQDGRPHTLELSIRAGFLADEDQASYALHYDERFGAVVAILGETPWPGQPYTLPARAALLGADRTPDEWQVSDHRAYLTYRLAVPAQEEQALCVVLTGGWSRAEHETLFVVGARQWRQALAGAEQHGDWLAGRLETEDRLLHSLFTAGLSTAHSSYHEDHAGRYQALLPSGEAGYGPEVTYPCDAYWCAQALLPFQPEWVRAEILTLARAIDREGRLGHGVWLLPQFDKAAGLPLAGWTDACDSPSYFAMLVHDYLAWTADWALLEEPIAGRSLWEKAQDCVNYLRRRDTNHDSLLEKGREQPDWAFDILRSDWVTYDLALHYQALKCIAEIAIVRGDEETARDFADWAAGAQRAINARLWDEGRGYYVDYVRGQHDFVEDHAAIDTVVATLFGLGTERQTHRHLEYLERILETRHNTEQYYGDWGVMSCFPFYKERADLTGRSAWAYSYHNGGAWPGWSGIYALAQLLHRRQGWRYALERWWTYSLSQYWFTPVEFYSPPYDAPQVRESAPLYAWSAMPAAAMILGGFGFWPGLAGDVVLRVPPWGNSRLNGVRFRGETYDVLALDGIVSVLHNGDTIASSPRGLRIRLGPQPDYTPPSPDRSPATSRM